MRSHSCRSKVSLLKDVVLCSWEVAPFLGVGHKVLAGSGNGVALSLLVNHHLLGAAHAVLWEAFAETWDLSASETAIGVGASNSAPEWLHVHVRLSTSLWNPEPGARAAFCRARWKVTWDLIGGNTFPWSVWQNSEDDQVFHGNHSKVWSVGDGKGRSSGHALVVGMESSVLLDTVWGVAWASPVFWMLTSVGPVAHETSIVAKSGESTVVCNLNGEGATCGKVKELACWRWDSVAASVMLEPPVLSALSIDRTHGNVVVLIIFSWVVTTFAVHASSPSGVMSMSNGAPCQQRE